MLVQSYLYDEACYLYDLCYSFSAQEECVPKDRGLSVLCFTNCKFRRLLQTQKEVPLHPSPTTLKLPANEELRQPQPWLL